MVAHCLAVLFFPKFPVTSVTIVTSHVLDSNITGANLNVISTHIFSSLSTPLFEIRRDILEYIIH